MFFFNRKKSTRAEAPDVALLTLDLSKLLKVVDSCVRPVHYNVADICIENFKKKWGVSTDVSLQAIGQMINTRRTELQVADTYTVLSEPYVVKGDTKMPKGHTERSESLSWYRN